LLAAWPAGPGHCYSVVRRRKNRDASGAATARISTIQAPSLPLRDRVRMACSLGAVFGGLLMAGHAFDNVPNAELGSQIRDAIRDLVADPGS
jgi:hypothetical protein